MSKSLGIGRSSGSIGRTTAQRGGRVRGRVVIPTRRRDSTARMSSSFPDSIDSLEQVSSLGGSTGAKLVRDPATGRQYVLKRGASPDHLRSEFAADRIYEAMGANVPAGRLYETANGPVKLTEFLEGKSLGSIPADRRAKYNAELQKHFAVDAILGNWDVIGLSQDNVLVDKSGKVWRIDNGGSLEFRAQGAKKTSSQWNNNPLEFSSMRDMSLNPSSASVFGSTSPQSIYKQIFELKKKAPKILKLLPRNTATVLGNRIDQAVKLAPSFKVR